MSVPIKYRREDGWSFEWNGSRTVNVYRPDGVNVDVFSLDYGRDWSMSDLHEIIDLCDEWEMYLV